MTELIRPIYSITMNEVCN